MTARAERMASVDPEWEPVPWGAPEEAAESMHRGFAERAATHIQWQKVPFGDFPQRLLGHDRRWFADNDVAYFASNGQEDLLLIDNVWSGWPDPPRWGLASRPRAAPAPKWQLWGRFRDLPAAWTFSEGQSPNA